MKFWVFFSILFAALIVGVHSDDRLWGEEEDECVVEFKLDKSVMQALNKHNITPEHNSDFNNFLACYWKKKGKLSSNGEINWQLIDDILVKEFQNAYRQDSELTTVLAENMVLHAVAGCRDDNIVADNPGQTVAKLRNCVKTKIHNAIENFEKTIELSHNLYLKLF